MRNAELFVNGRGGDADLTWASMHVTIGIETKAVSLFTVALGTADASIA